MRKKIFIFLGCFAIIFILTFIFSGILTIDRPDGYQAMQDAFRGNGLGQLLASATDALIFNTFLTSLKDTIFLWALLYLAWRYKDYLEPLHLKFMHLPRRWFLSILFFISLGMLCSIFYYNKLTFPVSGDEYSYLFQAKILALGKLYVPSPVPYDFFNTDWIVNNGKMYSQYPIGTSFFLMLGELVNIPWIICPLLAASTLVILYKLASEIFDETIARYGVGFVSLFPMFIGLSSSYFSHSLELFLAAAFIYLLLQCIRKETAVFPFLAGIVLGGMFNVRPLSAVILIFPFGGWAIYEMRTQGKILFKKLLLFCIGFTLSVLPQLWVNYIQNGRPFLFGYDIYIKNNPFFKGQNTFGFSAAYTPMTALATYFFRLWLLRGHLQQFTFLTPYLFFVFAILTLFYKNKYNYLFWALFFFTSMAYFFFAQGAVWHIRYYYFAIMLLVLLLPQGIITFCYGVSRHLWKVEGRHLVLIILCLAVGYRLMILDRQGLSPQPNVIALSQPYAIVKKAKIHNALVFIKKTKAFYPNWYVRNSPLLNDDIIYVLDLGPKNKYLMRQYPYRQYYLMDEERLSPLT